MSKYVFSFTLLIICQAAFGNINLRVDSNIVIESCLSKYNFQKNKLGKANVWSQTNTIYKNQSPTSLPLSEFYDDHTKILAFQVKLNKFPLSNFTPQDSYYTSKGIFHSDARVKYHELDLPAKATAELIVQSNTDDPLYFNTIYFTEEYNVKKKQITLKIPRWMNVQLKEVNFDGFNIEKSAVYNQKDDEDIITFTATNLPGTERENYSPGHSYTEPHLFILAKTDQQESVYFKNLQDQYNWYSNLVTGLNNSEPSIKQQALEITKDIGNDLDKIKSIYYWVQNNIRYIAFEDGIAGFKPDEASAVLKKKYGDCKGVANLTKALLSSLNIDARLCWIGTNHIAYNYYTPSLVVDNHMICAALSNGKTYFLDATEQFLGFEEYAERIQGRQVLIEDKQKYILTEIPTTKADMNLDELKAAYVIDGKNISAKVLRLWRGESKESLLSHFNTVKKDLLNTSIKSYLNNDNQNCEIEVQDFPKLDIYDKDVSANYKLTLKNGVEIFNNSYYVNLDQEKEYDNFKIDTATRKQDVWFGYKNNIAKEIELKIPANYTVSEKPKDLDIVTPMYEFKISYELQNDKIIYRKKIKILNARIAKKDFKQWNVDIEKLSQNYAETLTLKPRS